MFVGAADACIGISCQKLLLQEVRCFLMFSALNPFSCHKTVEIRHGREWSMTIEDALQIQDDDLKPIEDDL